MTGSLEAKRDPSFDPVRVPGDFGREFPGADGTATEVILNLTLAGTVTINRVEELLAQYGLVLKAFNVLAVVSGAAEPLTPTTITGRTFVGKTTVTSVLDALERRQLVRRYPHPSSRRSVLVEATAAGTQTCREILRRLHALEAHWLAGMAEPDRQTLLRLLGQAKGLLSRAQVPPRPASGARSYHPEGNQLCQPTTRSTTSQATSGGTSNSRCTPSAPR